MVLRTSWPPAARCFDWSWVKKPEASNLSTTHLAGAALRINASKRSVPMLPMRPVAIQMSNAFVKASCCTISSGQPCAKSRAWRAAEEGNDTDDQRNTETHTKKHPKTKAPEYKHPDTRTTTHTH